MELTHSFRDIVRERAMRDPEFRVGLLTEAIECVLNDEVDAAKVLLRDYVNAAVGFQELGILTQKNPKSLMLFTRQFKAERGVPVTRVPSGPL